MSSLKNELASSDYEVEAQDAERHSQLQPRHRLLSTVHSSRIALTVLALAAGITILGVSANGLLVYHETHLPAEFYLSLWPAQFDLRPTAALIAGGVIVTVANVVSLFFSKIQAVSTYMHVLGNYITIPFEYPASIVIVLMILRNAASQSGWTPRNCQHCCAGCWLRCLSRRHVSLLRRQLLFHRR